MTAFPVLALQSTQLPLADADAVHVDSLAAAAAATPPPGSGLDVLELIMHASFPVQVVMALLFLASLASWVIIFRKKRLLDRAHNEAEQFEQRFWSGADLGALYKSAGASAGKPAIAGLEAVFEAGFREYLRQRQRKGSTLRAHLDGAQRGMRVTGARELDGLERNLEFLANVGSIAPYAGLLGTVWGIMISFHGLANVREATIATVAPGISEALIATAMGLIAAIPAVWAYNRFATRVERLAGRYDAFADELLSILESQDEDG